ncbi:MAG: hypothetical protein HY863_06420 [Chloroflexi bacterium]|nr:hypothetical protein [Chloroflexota bacterium]
MPKSKDEANKPFSLDWKSTGIGVGIGMLLLFLIIARGGRVEEWNIGIAKFVFPTPTSVSDSNVATSSRKIESFPAKVFAFGGAYDSPPQKGLGFLEVEYQPQNRFVYHFSFDLPIDGTYGYAGFTFWFIDPNNAKQFSSQDLTSFNSIEITLKFESDLHHCQFFIKDIAYILHDESNHVNYTLLGQTAPPNSKIEKSGDEYKYTIPLSNFDKIDLKAVREVGFVVDAGVPQDERSFIVREILFTR